MTVTHIHHDRLCPAVPDSSAASDCLCDFIADIRDDERRALAPYLRSGPEIAAENRP